jgi:hypothetical protein
MWTDADLQGLTTRERRESREMWNARLRWNLQIPSTTHQRSTKSVISHGPDGSRDDRKMNDRKMGGEFLTTDGTGLARILGMNRRIGL